MQLKRARNSLLNISTIIPPEILAHIFLLNVTPEGEFGGLQKGSYNFLLVCHYWYEVASKTSGIWSFWGSNLYQWSRRYQRSGVTAPLDLVLSPYRDVHSTTDAPFDELLRNALQNRVASNSIRSLHLKSRNVDLLLPIVSSLTPVGEGIQHSNIESLILNSSRLDISDFIAHYHFPKLQHLHLFAKANSSTWRHLALHTAALTSLTLALLPTPQAPRNTHVGSQAQRILQSFACVPPRGAYPRKRTVGGRHSTTPTISQLLSILTSNPQLQTLSLTGIPHDNGDGSNSLIPLRRLRRLELSGDLPSVFRLLHQLDHPTTMDQIDLNLSGCTEEDISGTVGPYMRDRILHDGRFQDRLGVLVSTSYCSISIDATIVDDANGPTISRTYRHLPLMFYLTLKEDIAREEFGSLFVDFVAHLPREHVILFEGNMDLNATKEIVAMMPNIQELHLSEAPLCDGFLQPDPTGSLVDTKLLPSLRYLHLGSIHGTTWHTLVPYLIHQTSGGQAVSLRIAESSGHICSSVVETIKNLVQEFILEFDYDKRCPFNTCQGDGEQDDEDDDDVEVL